MRPGQKNQRMRGRPTNNRRGPNPLTRSYESNGPDVKIRGNAHHVAEKYLQLARDAHTGGDPVAAENYLQHAEHYFRLIAAAQAAQLQAQRPPGEGDADAEEEDEGSVIEDRFASPAERAPPPYIPPQPQYQPHQPQPNAGGGQPNFGERQPYDGDRPHPQERNGYQPRQDRQQQQNRHQDRGPRQDRPYQDRQEGYRDNRNPNDRQRDFRPYRDPNAPREPAPVPLDAAQPATLPSFITAPPRVIAGQENGEAQPGTEIAVEAGAGAEPAPAFNEAGGDTRFPGRGRRRRLRSPYGFHGGQNNDDAAPSPANPDEAPVSE